MQFKQYNDGSCDIEFSKEEITIVIQENKLHLSAENLRHFGNNLVKIVADWQLKFNEDISNKPTYTDTKIEGK
jgi:hypothetical protein